MIIVDLVGYGPDKASFHFGLLFPVKMIKKNLFTMLCKWIMTLMFFTCYY